MTLLGQVSPSLGAPPGPHHSQVVIVRGLAQAQLLLLIRAHALQHAVEHVVISFIGGLQKQVRGVGGWRCWGVEEEAASETGQVETQFTILTSDKIVTKKAPVGGFMAGIQAPQGAGSGLARSTLCGTPTTPEAGASGQGQLRPGLSPPGGRHGTSPAGTARSWRPRWHPAC